ncbi:hypothetical protein A6R68_19571, partial [Neotoma lepida]
MLMMKENYIFCEKCTAAEVAGDAQEDDVYQYVVRKPLNKEGNKSKHTKVSKFQCIVVPHVLL